MGKEKERGTCKVAGSTLEEKNPGVVFEVQLRTKSNNKVSIQFFQRIVSIFHVTTPFGAFGKRSSSDISTQRMLFLFKMEVALNSLCKEKVRYPGGRRKVPLGAGTWRWGLAGRRVALGRKRRGLEEKQAAHNPRSQKLPGSWNHVHLPRQFSPGFHSSKVVCICASLPCATKRSNR